MDGILLTGAGGYLGSRVRARLHADGIPFQALEGRLENLAPESLSCRVAIHCAGALRARRDQFQAANVAGLARLLAAMPQGAGIVHVSSRSVYPAKGHYPVDECEPLGPWDDYGLSKRAGEELICADGRPYVIFRSSALFGHPLRAGTFPDRALNAALAGEPIGVAVPDRQEDYLDVETLAHCMVSALRPGEHWYRILHAAGPIRSLAAMMTSLKAAVEGLGCPEVRLQARPIPVPATPLLRTELLRRLFPDVDVASDDAVFRRMLSSRRGVA